MGEDRRIGRSKGANPEEWYATFSPINVDNLDIEVYDNGSWYSLKRKMANLILICLIRI